MMTTRRITQNGFTLLEAIIVIVITGILSSIVAVFITRPVAGYVDATRRAQLTDAADGALRMMGRDIRSALPNSVRVNNKNGVFYLEFLATKAGGRFRQDDTCFTAGAGCSQLVTLGSIMAHFGALDANDRVVIYNQYNNERNNDCSANNPSAYCGQNTAAITAAGANTLGFANTVFLPALGTSPPGNRFQIIDGTQQAVTYACSPAFNGNNGTGTLTRQWGYGINAVQAVPPAGTTTALLANAVSGCLIQYAQGTTQNSGLVTLWLELMRNGERVSLNYQVHVINAP